MSADVVDRGERSQGRGPAVRARRRAAASPSAAARRSSSTWSSSDMTLRDVADIGQPGDDARILRPGRDGRDRSWAMRLEHALRDGDVDLCRGARAGRRRPSTPSSIVNRSNGGSSARNAQVLGDGLAVDGDVAGFETNAGPGRSRP